MSKIELRHFNEVIPEHLLAIVNEPVLRTHLVTHELFSTVSIREWMQNKVEINAQPGCRVRAVYVNGVLEGWCGIQPDDNGFELAIVISQEAWGIGISLFRTLMGWARELGHKEVLFHLLDSRPEYKALKKMASKVHKTELMGRYFTTYYIEVENRS